MTFKRLLLPMLVMGIILTMGSMAAFGQATNVTCYVVTATGDVNAPSATFPGAVAAPSLPGPSAHAADKGLVEVVAGGPRDVPNPGGVFTAGGGTIRVKCVNPTAAAISPGVAILVFSFGVPITNTQTHPTAFNGIRLSNSTGAFIAPTFVSTAGPTTAANITNAGVANIGIASVNNSAGQVVVGLGTPVAVSSTITPQNPTTSIAFPANSTSTFDLQGVLVSTSGKTGSVDVAMIDIAGAVTTAVGTAQVITSVAPALGDLTVPSTGIPAVVAANVNCLPAGTCTGGAAVLNSNGTALKSNFTMRVQEGFADMWKESGLQTAGDGFNAGGVFPLNASSDTTVFFKFTGLPAGFNVTNCQATLTDTNGNISVGMPNATTTVNSTQPLILVDFGAQPDQANIDVLWVTCATVGVGTAALPLPTTPITVQVEMGPEGTALTALGAAQTGLATGLVPRYTASYSPAAGVTVVLFPPSNTTLLIPFAAVAPGYNTGIAIANTTTDPFTPAGGGATPQDGTCTFTFYKNDLTSKAYTTGSSSPGTGLTSGSVKSGSTYVVNLSDLLASTAANVTTPFFGYVFVTCNFTNGHGSATVYTTADGAAALSAPVLVVGAISSAATRPSPEGLGQ